MKSVNRRNFLRGTAAAATGLILAGCDRLVRSTGVNAILDGAEGLDRRVRKIIARKGLAQEFPKARYQRSFELMEVLTQTAMCISNCSRMGLLITD